MVNLNVFRILLTLTHVLLAGYPAFAQQTPHPMVDPQANELTQRLYANLHALAGNGIMFGHQATLDYGYYWTHQELAPGELRSDVRDVSGSFPAVYGLDINHVTGPRWSPEQRAENIMKHFRWVRGAFERGGVITYEWHKPHPVGGRSFYDTTRVVHRIIPGGDLHDQFRASLDDVAEFFHVLAPVPVIFRPWHEHNGDWFWWCRGSTDEEDYIALWRYTVEYLRDVRKVNNLIYAYSPDRSRIDIDDFESGYLWGYPGDAYVDIIGLDNYWDLGHPANEATPEEQLAALPRSLEHTVRIAMERGKVAALTETGLEAIPASTWWTEIILPAVLENEYTRRITYFLVWRNANYQREQRNHYYAPFPGQVSANDFVRFRSHPFVLFEDDLPDMYRPFDGVRPVEMPIATPRE
jgi:mannan endo-1,4-beta-mannosidase